MGVITIKELLEAGVHFGHQTNRWNPKMKRYIFGERNGIYIIDLQQTLARFEAAYDFVRKTVAQGDSALFVGTKRQTSTIVEEEAKRCQMFNVSQRWLGGMLTNFNTIRKSIEKLRKIETAATDGTFAPRAPRKRSPRPWPRATCGPSRPPAPESEARPATRSQQGVSAPWQETAPASRNFGRRPAPASWTASRPWWKLGTTSTRPSTGCAKKAWPRLGRRSDAPRTKARSPPTSTPATRWGC